DASDDFAGVDITADSLTLIALNDIGGNPSAGMITDVLGALETTIASLEAHSTNAGDIVIVETDDIELKNVDTVIGSIDIRAKGNMTVADSVAGSDIKASENIMLYAGTDGTGDLSFEADVQLDAPDIFLRAGDGFEGAGTEAEVVMNDTPTVVAKTLTIQQDGDIGTQNNPWNPIVGINANIDLVLISDDSSIYSTDADSWKSITATAQSGITLEGTDTVTLGTGGGNPSLQSTNGNIEVLSNQGDLVVKGSVNADMNPNDDLGGGVQLISFEGSIFTDNIADGLNVEITGFSEGSSGVLLPLPFFYEDSDGDKAAIVIWCLSQDLKLGPGAVLTANGTYNPVSFDDRANGVWFDTSPTFGGDPIDVAIYLGSFGYPGGNVEMGSGRVNIANDGNPDTFDDIGSLVIDAYDTVSFFGPFEASLVPGAASTVEWLEVVSRRSDSINFARSELTLPHADNLSNIAGKNYHGKYVLRGGFPAKVLDFIDPVPLVPPRAEQIEEDEDVEKPDIEAMLEALRELGIYGVDLARANPQSLNTDVVPHWTAMERLLELKKNLDVTGDTYFASLRGVVTGVVSVDQPFDDSQKDVIVQGLSDRAGSSTEYALVKQWLDEMSEYVRILVSDVHQPGEKAVRTIMRNYGGFLREEFRTEEFVQWYIGRTIGG
ncbi:MAG: autotransporter outer membrane beta-barrel domain-containing protein, partial [Planctomycetota bacterium]